MEKFSLLKRKIMSILSRNLCLIFCLLLLSSLGFGQINTNESKTDTAEKIQQERERVREIYNNPKNFDLFPAGNESVVKRVPRKTNEDEKPYTQEELEQIAKQLEPNPEDAARYSNFLTQLKTGLFRLFPNLHCQSKNLIRVDGKCENYIPGSWSYSFRQKERIFEKYNDISFGEEYLIADGFLSQGIFVELGDLPLEEVSLDAEGLKFLVEYQPEAEDAKATRQLAQIAETIKVGDYIYSNKIKPSENTTYAMRVIAYRVKDKDSPRIFPNYGKYGKYFKYRTFNQIDKRIDLTLAFRVIGKDEDGSISILWKELKQQDSPELVFPKVKKSKDK